MTNGRRTNAHDGLLLANYSRNWDARGDGASDSMGEGLEMRIVGLVCSECARMFEPEDALELEAFNRPDYQSRLACPFCACESMAVYVVSQIDTPTEG